MGQKPPPRRRSRGWGGVGGRRGRDLEAGAAVGGGEHNGEGGGEGELGREQGREGGRGRARAVTLIA